MNADGKRLDEMSERVIGCAFTGANTLGTGFLEKVHENARVLALTKAGLIVRQQVAIECTRMRADILGRSDLVRALSGSVKSTVKHA